MPADWPIAACATGPGEIQLLARGAEGDLLHGTFRRGEWNGFECIGSPAVHIEGIGVPMPLSSAPSACSRAPGSMDVFAVGAAGMLLHSTWDGTEFSELEPVGGIPPPGGGADAAVPPPISACACGPRAIAVAVRGAAGDLVVKWWNAGSWGPFASVGIPSEPDPIYPIVPITMPLTSAPAVCGGGSARLDAFARGARGDLLHKWWDGKAWSGFESLGFVRPAPEAEPVPLSGVSLACAWGRFKLEIFVRGSDAKLYHASWSGSGGLVPAASP